MKNPRFWVAAGCATAAQVAFRHLEWLLTRVLVRGSFDFMTYPYRGPRAFMLLGEAAVCLLITLIITTKGVAAWNRRDGFQIGAYCGLLNGVMAAAAGIIHDSPLGSVVYHLLFSGIVGGVEGAIITRVLQGSGVIEKANVRGEE